MKKMLICFLLLSVVLFSREVLSPVKSCPAFNNMKHATNSHNVILEREKKYTILDHHKGQILLLVKGEQPAQRWVDESCFSQGNANISSIDTAIEKLDKSAYVLNNKTKKQMLLALSWHNAFCETHRNKKECKRNMFSLYRSKHRDQHFILHGFWPQPRNNIYCNVPQRYITMDKYRHWNKLPDLDLTEETKTKLAKIMPGVHSSLHKHEWIKHGTCYGTNAETYFKESIALTEQFYDSEVSRFFERNVGKKVTLKQIRILFDKSFGEGSGKKVELQCKNGLITELWLHLGIGSHNLATLLQNGKQIRSRCDRGRIDRAGFSKEISTKADFGR